MSWQLVVMVSFACLSFVANRLGNAFLPDQRDLVSAGGALVIGLLGNVYSRIVRGTAFTSMVTGVLFLVPVSAQRNFPEESDIPCIVWYRFRWRASR